MMNDTVARIVDLMFDNAEMNEDVAALRDEVMNNCQERYSDLVSSGVPEDDAVAAVVESLRGMEDVIAQYSKKSRKAAVHREPERREPEYTQPPVQETEESGERHLIFSAAEIHQIDLTLVNEDVTLERSDDRDYHVLWNADESPLVQAVVERGVLKIDRRPGDAATVGRDGRVTFHHRDDHSDFVRMEDGNINIDLSNMDGMLKSVGQTLKNVFSKISISIGACSSVTIQVPDHAIPHVKLLTTSGDIEVTEVGLTELNVTSTSGDINVEMDEDEPVRKIGLRTTSGDIEATVYTQGMTVSSTSGDVEVEGRISLLAVNTISGDIDVRADVKNMTFKAISGDVDLDFESDEIRDISGSTISGDVEIDLPEGIGAIAINTNTRSGDVTTRYATNGYGPTVGGSVTSMSGDITIR